MDFLERLKGLEKTGTMGNRPKSKPHRNEDLASLLGGKEVSNSKGEYVLIEKRFAPSFQRGCVPLSNLLDIDPADITALAGSQIPKGIDLSQTVFLDTETTGLAGGTGTYPFLIGVGHFQDNQFVLKQFFMRDHGGEKAILSDLATLLEEKGGMVTYNGKGYDLPLLRTRYILNRLKNSLELDPHLDLLYPARRVWKRRIGDCSLGNLENHILGVEREADIPSYLIPQAYFDFLRTGELSKIHLIMEHNTGDITSLAGLLGYLARMVTESGTENEYHPQDLFSLGRHFYFSGNWAKARGYLEKVAPLTRSDDFGFETALLLGRLYKKTNDWSRAEEIWKGCLEHFSFSPEPYIELAKFYEHRVRDFRKALGLVERSIDNLNGCIHPQVSNSALENLYYRKARLLRKLAQ